MLQPLDLIQAPDNATRTASKIKNIFECLGTVIQRSHAVSEKEDEMQGMPQDEEDVYFQIKDPHHIHQFVDGCSEKVQSLMAEHFSIKKKVQEVNKVQRMNQQLIEFKRLQQEKMEKEFF